MRVLVTGALGFVGVNLVRRFATAGSDVTALDLHKPDPAAARFLSGVAPAVRHVRGDVTDRGWAGEAGPGYWDLVVHAAALTPLAEGQEGALASLTCEVNVVGTANVLAWAAGARPGRLMYVSSGSVYGTPGGREPLDETAEHRPGTVYGITKSAAERVARRLGRLAGLDVLVVRLSQPYGPMERATGSRSALSPVHDWCAAAVRGEPALVDDDLDLTRDYLHVDDLVDAVHRLATLPAPTADVYNVGPGVAVSLRAVLETVRRRFPGLQVAPGGAHLTAATVRPPLRIDRLTTETGWAPHLDLRAGVDAYVDWLLPAPAAS